jgi:hypothetical protein
MIQDQKLIILLKSNQPLLFLLMLIFAIIGENKLIKKNKL